MNGLAYLDVAPCDEGPLMADGERLCAVFDPVPEIGVGVLGQEDAATHVIDPGSHGGGVSAVLDLPTNVGFRTRLDAPTEGAGLRVNVEAVPLTDRPLVGDGFQVAVYEPVGLNTVRNLVDHVDQVTPDYEVKEVLEDVSAHCATLVAELADLRVHLVPVATDRGIKESPEGVQVFTEPLAVVAQGLNASLLRGTDSVVQIQAGLTSFVLVLKKHQALTAHGQYTRVLSRVADTVAVYQLL